MRRFFRPVFCGLWLTIAMIVAACSSGSDTTETAAQPAPSPTVDRQLPSIVPDPSPTPFVLPTIVASTTPVPVTTVPTETGDADRDDEGDQETAPTPSAVPSATPRPIPTAVPTTAATPRPAATAVVVAPTATPVRPTSTAVPTSAPLPTATPTYVEVGCTISDRSIVVDEIITLTAFQDPVNVPITFSFEHGDGTIDRRSTSYAYYEAPGSYDVIMRWQQGGQRGRTFCGTVMVQAAGGTTPTPTPTPVEVQIGCTVSDRNIVVNEIITLRASHTPGDLPVAYVFLHGDGTRDATAESRAFYRDPGYYQVELEFAYAGTSGKISCGTVTVTPNVSIASYVGKTADQATALAATHGLTLRIVRIDDEHFAGTTDARLDRVNVEIDDGIVTKAYLG